nr:NUDIX domain-containing protein [Chitinophagaceae bacterium]
MPVRSAGILLYHFDDGHLKVFIVHPGGPFWKNKDLGTWSLPKGEFSEDELPLNAAIREFEEETGQKIAGDFIELHPVKLKSGKIIYAWALNGNVDAEKILSNEIEIDWPPRSGKKIMIPEVDK